MPPHRRWRMLWLTAAVLAGLVAGAEAAADVTMLILGTNHNPHDLIVIPGATDRILTHPPVGPQPYMAVISRAGKVYTTGRDTDTASGVNHAAILRNLRCTDNQDAGEMAVIDSMQDTAIP
jgi:DNA-binding beta-propeller fold protein YncE